jgi:hypothetical protein
VRYPQIGDEPAPESFFEELRACRDAIALIDLAQCHEWEPHCYQTRMTPLTGNRLESMLSFGNGMAASKQYDGGAATFRAPCKKPRVGGGDAS